MLGGCARRGSLLLTTQSSRGSRGRCERIVIVARARRVRGTLSELVERRWATTGCHVGLTAAFRRARRFEAVEDGATLHAPVKSWPASAGLVAATNRARRVEYLRCPSAPANPCSPSHGNGAQGMIARAARGGIELTARRVSLARRLLPSFLQRVRARLGNAREHGAVRWVGAGSYGDERAARLRAERETGLRVARRRAWTPRPPARHSTARGPKHSCAKGRPGRDRDPKACASASRCRPTSAPDRSLPPCRIDRIPGRGRLCRGGHDRQPDLMMEDCICQLGASPDGSSRAAQPGRCLAPASACAAGESGDRLVPPAAGTARSGSSPEER